MNYRGRQIDPVVFWGKYVEFPSSMHVDGRDEFSSKVVCPNPDHDTSKFHFQVNLQQPTVHCFAYCGISGSYEHAICVIEGLYEKFQVDMDAYRSGYGKKRFQQSAAEKEAIARQGRAYREARKIILRSSQIGSKFHRTAVVRKKTRSDSRSASVIPAESLEYESFLPQRALEYLKARGITDNSIAEWRIGWLPDERRVVIPGEDENGATRFLIKRAISDRQQPKYLYTEGFPKTSLLFGACKLDLKQVKSEGLILVEGSVDVIVLRQLGFKNAVAILGTGISERQRRIIARINPLKIYLLFDKDSAGIRNIEIAVGMLRKYPLYVVRYPSTKSDPAELTGSEAQRQIARAVPALRFVRTNGLHVKTRERISIG
jgi:hypothetical protein